MKHSTKDFLEMLGVAAFGIGIVVGVLFGLPYVLSLQAQTTGVCIFKGPATYGLLSNSPRIPLRGIDVRGWFIDAFNTQHVSGEGPTDRQGCFTFQAYSGHNYFVGYTYNGTAYSEPVQPGVILQENVP